MKPFSRVLLAAMTAALILVTPVSGQGPDGQPPDGPPPDGGPGGSEGRNLTPEQMIQRRVEMLDRQLNLTPAQEKKITEILKKESKSAPAAKTTASASRRDRLNKAKSTENGREKVDAEIKKVLTPAQAKKYGEMSSRNRGQFSADNQIQRLDARLKLTAQQKQKLRVILENQSKEMQKMTPQQNGQEVDREKMRANFEKMREKTNKQIEAILTPQQKKEYAAMQKERQERMQTRQNTGQQQ